MRSPGRRPRFPICAECPPYPAATCRAGSPEISTHPSFAAFCLLPTPPQHSISSSRRRAVSTRAQGLEPASLALRPVTRTGALRLGKAGKLLRARVFPIKQLADLASGRSLSPSCSACQACSERQGFGVSAADPAPVAAPRLSIADLRRARWRCRSSHAVFSARTGRPLRLPRVGAAPPVFRHRPHVACGYPK